MKASRRKAYDGRSPATWLLTVYLNNEYVCELIIERAGSEFREYTNSKHNCGEDQIKSWMILNLVFS